MHYGKKIFILMSALVFVTFSYASTINRLELAKLPGLSETTVLAQVLKVDRKSDSADEVTIKIASVIKGNVQSNELKVMLSSRGVKDFDPALNIGDTGVFFLKEVRGSDAKLAYWGSVAIFQKSHFETTAK